MLITHSVDGVPIRLTGERWDHICRRHPELNNQKERVLETIGDPMEVLKGDFGEKLAVRFYRRTPLTAKYLIVAYRELSEQDGFVVTAYLARRLVPHQLFLTSIPRWCGTSARGQAPLRRSAFASLSTPQA